MKTPDMKNISGVKRKREFEVEYKVKVWDYVKREMEKGVKISWVRFFPEKTSIKERKRVAKLFKRMKVSSIAF